MQKPIETLIRTRLTKGLDLRYLQIENQSHLHAGHKAMQGVTHAETHFVLRLWAKEFESLSLVKQQRLVYGLLKDLMPQPIHALSLKIKSELDFSG
ncbi:MAG: BolA family transcriptional regulator [Rickettsiales bacterium]|nr:BolA family transcriptional regulator [Rickettsiales bacterium]|tara:strand:+ start:1711 stop:1998 length:288 start_codon:yes stop_codon:yes gene_type:complete